MKKLLFLALIICTSSLFAQNKTKVEHVDAATFKKYIAEKKGELIDLRTTDELNSKGMIKGAKQIDFLGRDAEKEITQLDHNKAYLIYCAGGGRSSECAELMQKQGFKRVITLKKGFDDWAKQGLPVEQSK
jgi:phage shock protein E